MDSQVSAPENIHPSAQGTVVSVRGSIIDAHFPHRLPLIHSLLKAGEELEIAIDRSRGNVPERLGWDALPSSPVCLRLRGRLHDAQIKLNNHRPRNTWFGRHPCARIDHVFVDPSIEVVAMEVPNTELTRVACDHLPLIADVRIPVSF